MNEVLRDLREPHPMQRLLQGDVGSGKTIVAAIACLAAVDSGAQAAVMAPTEILSEQHWRKFNEWLAPLGVRLGCLRGGMAQEGEDERIAARRGAVRHRHARADPGGRASSRALALAVVDEQHRFGVEQRLALRKKATGSGAAPAHDERDADPAHAVDDLLRRPRRLDHRRAAARAAAPVATRLFSAATRAAKCWRASARPAPKGSRRTGCAR